MVSRVSRISLSTSLANILHAFQDWHLILTLDNSWYVAYFTIASFVSTLYALLDLTLYFFARLAPYYAGLGSTVLAIGWILQLAFWLQCDFIPDYNQCQQFYLVHQNRASYSGAAEGVSTDVTYARVALGFILVAL